MNQSLATPLTSCHVRVMLILLHVSYRVLVSVCTCVITSLPRDVACVITSFPKDVASLLR